MLTYQSQVTIDRPPDVVFPYLIEPDRQKLWSDVPMQRLDQGPLGVGSRMELTMGMGPIKTKIGLRLAAIEVNRRLAFESFSGSIRWSGEYVLTPTASGATEVRQRGELTFSGLWRLLERLVGAEISRCEIKELERLKQAVERP